MTYTTAVVVVLALLVCQLNLASSALPTYIGKRPVYPHRINFQQTVEGDVVMEELTRDAPSDYPTVYESTYLSQAMPLADGEVVFTDPTLTFLPFPSGPIAIHGFYAEVVDEYNVSVPLSEAYLHHWLVFGPPNKGLCGGYLQYNFGVGAESRGAPVMFPPPYALVTNQTEQWGANIHILRTTNLSPEYGVKNCIECMWGPGKGCSQSETGEFACCEDGSFCVRGPNASSIPKNYFLKYTVWWAKASPVAIPLDIYVLDASYCLVEYNIYPDPSNISITTWYHHFPASGELVFAVGHQHIGANYISLSIGQPGSETEVCTSVPRYGTEEGVPGNEKGYVVEIKPCSFPQGVTINQGDRINLYSNYSVAATDERTFDGGMHGGVMSLWYMAIAPKRQ